jgi:hypothetical protein
MVEQRATKAGGGIEMRVVGELDALAVRSRQAASTKAEP